MTEIQPSANGRLGLFTTKNYKAGDTVLSELHPLVRLAPKSDEESRRISTEWCGHQKQPARGERSSDATLWGSIDVPGTITDSGTFKGMVQAGILWMKQSAETIDVDTTRKLMELYHPYIADCTEAEKSVVKLAEQAIEYIQQQAATSSGTEFAEFQGWEMLQKVLLVWACNSFQSGRIYDAISRINHSCNPNAVIVQAGEDGNGQRVVAAVDIEAGTEITISYLGLLLYAGTGVRRKKLLKTKYFECQCSRCVASQEGASQIPCPTCHPRHPTQLCLDEDVQYDDDQEVQYVCYGQTCTVCNKSPLEACERLEKVSQSVCEKIESFLETYESLNSKNATTTSDNDNDENDAVLEEHVGLASTMMGRKHWTTNLTLLLHLDRRLSTMSQQMLMTQELPEMEEVAEAIDTLQRLFGYVKSLKVDLDAGHVLGDVTIGVARTLVSLGDEKSQKYGAEWLDKINGYVETFGDEGLQKVVDAIHGAWRKEHDHNCNVDNTGEMQPSKRRKTKGKVTITSSTDVPADTFVRSVPHRKGHWAGHVKIPVPNTKFWKKQKKRSLHKFKLLLEEHGYSGSLVEHETIHISLSKPFSLQISQIESFRKRLLVLLQHHLSTNLHLDMDHPILLTNDENTRTFWCWKVLANPTLLKIVEQIDSTLEKYNQPPYYQPPVFHISIASFPEKVNIDNADLSSDTSNSSGSEETRTVTSEINTLALTSLDCNFGTTRNFVLPLKAKIHGK
jgi:hypothetical protein